MVSLPKCPETDLHYLDFFFLFAEGEKRTVWRKGTSCYCMNGVWVLFPPFSFMCLFFLGGEITSNGAEGLFLALQLRVHSWQNWGTRWDARNWNPGQLYARPVSYPPYSLSSPILLFICGKFSQLRCVQVVLTNWQMDPRGRRIWNSVFQLLAHFLPALEKLLQINF